MTEKSAFAFFIGQFVADSQAIVFIGQATLIISFTNASFCTPRQQVKTFMEIPEFGKLDEPVCTRIKQVAMALVDIRMLALEVSSVSTLH